MPEEYAGCGTTSQPKLKIISFVFAGDRRTYVNFHRFHGYKSFAQNPAGHFSTVFYTEPKPAKPKQPKLTSL